MMQLSGTSVLPTDDIHVLPSDCIHEICIHEIPPDNTLHGFTVVRSSHVDTSKLSWVGDPPHTVLDPTTSSLTEYVPSQCPTFFHFSLPSVSGKHSADCHLFCDGNWQLSVHPSLLDQHLLFVFQTVASSDRLELIFSKLSQIEDQMLDLQAVTATWKGPSHKMKHSLK